MPASVENTSLLRGPLPCDPAAETALQPLTWCSVSLSSQRFSPPEGFFFVDTGTIACSFELPRSDRRASGKLGCGQTGSTLMGPLSK